MRTFLKSKKKVSKLVKQKSNIIHIRFPTLCSSTPPLPLFPHTYLHHFFNFAALIFLIYYAYFVYMYVYQTHMKVPPSFGLMIPVQKGPRFTYAPPPPPPLSVDFSSSLYVCLSVCLSLSLACSLFLSFH